jgi:hypothetical protein
MALELTAQRGSSIDPFVWNRRTGLSTPARQLSFTLCDTGGMELHRESWPGPVGPEGWTKTWIEHAGSAREEKCRPDEFVR